MEGFKAITVSVGTHEELKQRAEKEGLSLHELIKQYMETPIDTPEFMGFPPHPAINRYLWIDEPESVRRRIDTIAGIIRQNLMESRANQRAKDLRLKGEVVGPLPYDLRVQWDQECTQLALDIAQTIIEEDRKVFEALKKKRAEDELKLHVRVNIRGLEQDLKGIFQRAQNVLSNVEGGAEDKGVKRWKFSPLQLMEMAELMKKREELQKYVPYLPEELQNINQKTGELLFQNGLVLEAPKR